MKETGGKKVQCHCTDPHYTKLKMLATVTGRTIQYHLLQAIKEYTKGLEEINEDKLKGVTNEEEYTE